MANQGSMGTVPFGLRDGVLHFVSQVETGIACNCVCPDPACAKPLVARNRHMPTRQRAYYFAHATQTPGCGGRESALHRMGKEIVERATHLILPAWSALDGELSFASTAATLAPGSAQEVTLRDGQMRPDVKIIALSGQAFLQALYVKIKVSHAVDLAKRERVIKHGLTMVEIDLADVADIELQDEAAFTHHVLERTDNRHWLNIGSAAFLTRMLGQRIAQVTNQEVREKRVPTKNGNQLHLQEQAMVRHDPTDHFDNPLPYAPGLYVVGYVPGRGTYYDNSHYKTQLRPIIQDTPWHAQ